MAPDVMIEFTKSAAGTPPGRSRSRALSAIASCEALPSAIACPVDVQLPEPGLLTVAMTLPIVTGRLNVAIIYTANSAGFTLA